MKKNYPHLVTAILFAFDNTSLTVEWLKEREEELRELRINTEVIKKELEKLA